MTIAPAPARQNPGQGEPRRIDTGELAELLERFADDGVADSVGEDADAQDRDVLRHLARAFRAGALPLLPEDLLGSKEAAKLLGVDRTTVSRWRKARYMPAPFCELATGPVWLRPVLEAFAERHRRTADGAGRRQWGTAER